MFLGFIIFTFTVIAAKINGKYYFAPIVTFLMSIAITAYGLFIVGGWDGMAYGLLAIWTQMVIYYDMSKT